MAAVAMASEGVLALRRPGHGPTSVQGHNLPHSSHLHKEPTETLKKEILRAILAALSLPHILRVSRLVT